MVSSNASSPKENIETEQAKSSHNQIKQVIGVMSSKGGVGKSFVTGLLACGLAKEGYQVGILDADFTGSSIPMLFGLHGPVKVGQYSFIPLQSSLGIKIISTNLLFEDEGQSIIWKESLVGKVIEELWKEVEWGTLDYLFVDMPPATSEVAVAIMQSLPFKGVVIVTTPQVLATNIVKKAIFIAQRIGVHILGIVENMAYYRSPETGKAQYLFGQCQGESVANSANAPLLGQLPIDPKVSQFCDLGKIEDVMLGESSTLITSFLESLSVVKDIPTFPSAVQNNGSLSFPQIAHVGNTFSDNVIRLIQNKENMGELDHPDAQGLYLGSCGDRMQIDLRISEKKILEAKFLADGCGATMACGSMITKMVCSKTLDEAGKITAEDLLTALGGLPEDHKHCAELAVMTIREAVIDALEGHATNK